MAGMKLDTSKQIEAIDNMRANLRAKLHACTTIPGIAAAYKLLLARRDLLVYGTAPGTSELSTFETY